MCVKSSSVVCNLDQPCVGATAPLMVTTTRTTAVGHYLGQKASVSARPLQISVSTFQYIVKPSSDCHFSVKTGNVVAVVLFLGDPQSAVLRL